MASAILIALKIPEKHPPPRSQSELTYHAQIDLIAGTLESIAERVRRDGLRGFHILGPGDIPVGRVTVHDLSLSRETALGETNDCE